ncbi:hypothetical protein HBI65_122840 [Parastagonospora nodorum]|nr:hypothetical protein HBI65_122840 [Parastagonospora nodorum]
MPTTHRSTQRAPLSCTSCASRKVKCSKAIPCRACISRGAAADCKREVVFVRGRIRTADIPGSSPSIAELLLENARLAELLSRSHAGENSYAPVVDLTEYYEKRLYDAVGRLCEARVVTCIEDIVKPTQACSCWFVEFAQTWTSWVHFAFFFPRFRQEHEGFWAEGASFTSFDPLWLAVYFATLASALGFMSDEDFMLSGAPLPSRVLLTRNWYSATLFYLDQGDFLQKSNILVVQAIVVLGNVASTIGETHRHANLWAVAIRIAQQLNLGSDEANLSETLVQRETRRRLWWTLVICEWLPIPLRPPCINDTDFTCQLPADISDAQLLASDSGVVSQPDHHPRAVQYHITMARIATIYHHLHAKLRLRKWSPSGIADFVIQADDHLADVIEQIPPHLQNNDTTSPHTEALHPWIATQRTSLAIVLLYYRLAINRILQTYWLEGSTNFARARSVCLSSAIGVIGAATAGDATFRRLRSWDFAMVTFSATVTLALEVRRSREADERLVRAIRDSERILGGVRGENVVAREGVGIWQELRNEGENAVRS